MKTRLGGVFTLRVVYRYRVDWRKMWLADARDIVPGVRLERGSHQTCQLGIYFLRWQVFYLRIFMLLRVILLLIANSLFAANVYAARDADKRLSQLAEQFFQERLQRNPLAGSQQLGEARFEDKLAITIAPTWLRAEKVALQTIQRELNKIPLVSLNDADKLTHALLAEELRDSIESLAHPGHLMPIDHFGGLPVYFAQLGSGQQIQPLKTVANFDNFYKRLSHLPAWNKQAITNMREGMQRGVVLPKVLTGRALESLRNLTESDFDKSLFSQPLKAMPKEFSEADRARLTTAYKKLFAQSLLPSMRELVRFMEKEYMPRGRDTAGVNALPGGAEWYAYTVRHHTTTSMTADEIHHLGLKEVARIRGEMDKIRQHYKFDGDITAFLKWHFEQPQFRPFKTEKEVLDAYAAMNTKLLAILPQYFGRAPKAPLEIRAVPEIARATASDHYSSPAPDGSRPGVFYTVIEDPRSIERQEWRRCFCMRVSQGITITLHYNRS